jgi:hypothetical protein
VPFLLNSPPPYFKTHPQDCKLQSPKARTHPKWLLSRNLSDQGRKWLSSYQTKAPIHKYNKMRTTKSLSSQILLPLQIYLSCLLMNLLGRRQDAGLWMNTLGSSKPCKYLAKSGKQFNSMWAHARVLKRAATPKNSL